MNFLIWILILTLFVLSFIALIYPVLPSISTVWAGFLFYHFFLNSMELTPFFWIVMGIFTFIVLLSDILASSLAVKKYGGTKLGERVAGVSVILGSFIYPPLGIVLLPFIAVFLAEWSQEQSIRQAWNSAVGSLVGFFSGQIATALIQFIMIGWFFFTIWF